MEPLQDFQLELDFSSCERLYDYYHQQEHLKPEDGWDLVKIHEMCQIDDYKTKDLRYKYLMKIMENCHRETRLMEKDDKKSAIKNEGLKLYGTSPTKAQKSKDNFPDKYQKECGDNVSEYGSTLNLNKNMGNSDSFSRKAYDCKCLPAWVLPVFKPGDKVQGHLYIDLEQDLNAEYLSVEFIDKAVMNIRSHSDTGYADDPGKEAYAEVKEFFWYKKDTKYVHPATIDKEPQLPASEKIPAGVHRFRFEYFIPYDAPGSVPPLVTWDDYKAGNYAHITCFLKATIEKGNKYGRGNICRFQSIWVDRPKDIAADLENLQPISVEKVIPTGFFLKSGTITVRATLSKKGFIRKEPVKIKIEVDNQASEEICNIGAKICIKGKYFVKNDIWHPLGKIDIQTMETFDGPIASNMCPTYTWALPLEFMASHLDSNLAPVGDFSDCSIIKPYYVVKIKLRRKGLKPALKMEIPINVGSCNSKDE